MTSRLITDAMLEAALQVISTTAEQTAAARAIRVRAEFRRKRVRARLIHESNLSSASAREAWAEQHEDYAKACEDEVQATENDEFLRAQRNDAATVIDAWRTENASNRAGSSFR